MDGRLGDGPEGRDSQAVGDAGRSRKPATAKAAAAPIKLTERQLEFLKMIHGTKEPGFLVGARPISGPSMP